MRRPTVVLLVLGALCAAPDPSRGDFVEFVAEGTLQVVNDLHHLLDESVDTRETIRVTVGYDTEAPRDPFCSSSFLDCYFAPVPPSYLRVDVGVYSIEAPGMLRIGVSHQFVDDYSWRSDDAFPFPGLPGARVGIVAINFRDDTNTAIDGPSLPAAPPQLALFDTTLIRLDACLDTEALSSGYCPGNPSIALRAPIDTVTLVPEPDAAAIGVGACLALGGIARVRRLPPPRA